MKCFFHSDLDGRSSAAIVLRSVGNIPIDLIEFGYKGDFPLDCVSPGEVVYVVDLDLQKNGDWEKLLEKTDKVVWIDHHETALSRKGPQQDLEGIRSMDGSAALLTWKMLGGSGIPRAIELVSDFDTWTHAFGQETLNFMYGMKSFDDSPRSPIWVSLLEGNTPVLANIIAAGVHIGKAWQRDDAEYLSQLGFETKLDGYSAYAVNKARASSLMFGSKGDEYDLMISFAYDGNTKSYVVSLYTKKPNIHVGEIAKKRGGGGHKGASGFSCKKLPF